MGRGGIWERGVLGEVGWGGRCWGDGVGDGCIEERGVGEGGIGEREVAHITPTCYRLADKNITTRRPTKTEHTNG